jgi:hypothetical protein
MTIFVTKKSSEVHSIRITICNDLVNKHTHMHSVCVSLVMQGTSEDPPKKKNHVKLHDIPAKLSSMYRAQIWK